MRLTNAGFLTQRKRGINTVNDNSIHSLFAFSIHFVYMRYVFFCFSSTNCDKDHLARIHPLRIPYIILDEDNRVRNTRPWKKETKNEGNAFVFMMERMGKKGRV